MNNKLKINNINFSYANKQILNNISFECTNGITSLLGHNGAGKSTLINILVGLKKCQTGDVFLNNTNITDLNTFINIGYLPQNFDIFPNVTGYDFLSYVCDLKNIPKKEKKNEIDFVVENFSLEKVINCKFSKYSGGFRRRLGIAQAMIGNPNLIIIDEPTVGLDPEQRLEFRHFLSKIGNDKVTLVSTHITEDAELYSNKILIINEGNLSFSGSVDKLLSIARKNISSSICEINELNSIRNSLIILEEKRISDIHVKFKFINTNNSININSQLEKEVSLENAYIFFQKQKHFLL